MSVLEIIGLITIAPIVIYWGIALFILVIGIISNIFNGEKNEPAQVRKKVLHTKENL